MERGPVSKDAAGPGSARPDAATGAATDSTGRRISPHYITAGPPHTSRGAGRRRSWRAADYDAAGAVLNAARAPAAGRGGGMLHPCRTAPPRPQVPAVQERLRPTAVRARRAAARPGPPRHGGTLHDATKAGAAVFIDRPAAIFLPRNVRRRVKSARPHRSGAVRPPACCLGVLSVVPPVAFPHPHPDSHRGGFVR